MDAKLREERLNKPKAGKPYAYGRVWGLAL